MLRKRELQKGWGEWKGQVANGITATAAAEATKLQQPAKGSCNSSWIIDVPQKGEERVVWREGDGKQIANACLPVSKSHLRATFKM